MKTLYTFLFVVSFKIMCAQIDPSFGSNGHFTFGTLDKDDYPSFIKPTLDNAFIVGDYEMHTTPAKGVLY